MYWTTSSGRIELNVTLADAQACSHAGDCQEDVEWLKEKPSIRHQLAKLDPATVRAELGEYGAWDDKELSDHDWNMTRLLWLACADVAEEAYASKRR
jgi:hypothetical protein